jgi:anaphase-promoting complex subunit 6
MHVLLGEAYEAVDQRSRAAQCYRIAIKIDVMCYEAFQRLVDGFMQTSAEESELLQSLKFPPDMPWLEHVYRAKIKRFVDQLPMKSGRGTSIDETYGKIQEAYGLSKNDDLLQSKAEDLVYCNQPQKAYEITKKALERDPFNYGSLLLVHVAALVALQNKSELFYLAHKIVEENPKLPIGWYTVGCYYFTIKNYPQARRYIHKATVLDKDFGAAWLAFGHVFAAEAEPDQALAAYRTAARLLVGSHIPPLCIGMELIRSNNPSLGLDFAVKAFKMRPEDPLILNEIGVCLIRGNQFEKAADHFVRALDLIGSRVTEFWEPTLFNLGHCYRKMRQYDLADKYYSTALSLSPHNSSTHTALGLTCHLQGKLDQAIEHYHTALGLQPEDPTFASDLLKRALEESLADIVPITHTFGPLAGLTEPPEEEGGSLDMEPEDDDV